MDWELSNAERIDVILSDVVGVVGVLRVAILAWNEPFCLNLIPFRVWTKAKSTKFSIYACVGRICGWYGIIMDDVRLLSFVGCGLN